MARGRRGGRDGGRKYRGREARKRDPNDMASFLAADGLYMKLPLGDDGYVDWAVLPHGSNGYCMVWMAQGSEMIKETQRVFQSNASRYRFSDALAAGTVVDPCPHFRVDPLDCDSCTSALRR